MNEQDDSQIHRRGTAREDRATGLRSHNREPRMAKESLKSGDYDSPPKGKRCRYSEHYGSYEL